MIGRVIGLGVALVVALGGALIGANAAVIAGRFDGPLWVLASVYMLALCVGIVLGVTGAWLGLAWMEARNMRRARNAKH